MVDLINRFGGMLTQMDRLSMSDLEGVLGELAAYAKYHFQNEEDLMTEMGVDARHVKHHLKLHFNFLNEVMRLYGGVAKEVDVGESLLKFLVYWLAFHILGTDQSLARQIFAIRSGQTAEEAFDAEQIIKESATEPLLEALSGLFHLISERNRELLELNRTLEAKVEERTHALSEVNNLLEQIALTDVLTGLPNRRHAMSRLAQAWSESSQDLSPLSCIMIDADNFKRLDSPAKINGTAIFGIDVDSPGMLTAVIARPPVFGGTVKSFESTKTLAVPGVRAVVAVDAEEAVAEHDQRRD